MRFNVVDDLEVDLLENEVQLVQNLALDLEEYVLTGFVHIF